MARRWPTSRLYISKRFTPGSGARLRFVALNERLEDERALPRRDSRPGIFDDELKLTLARAPSPPPGFASDRRLRRATPEEQTPECEAAFVRSRYARDRAELGAPRSRLVGMKNLRQRVSDEVFSIASDQPTESGVHFAPRSIGRQGPAPDPGLVEISTGLRARRRPPGRPTSAATGLS